MDWKKMKTYSEHTFLQTISVLSPAESKNKLSFLMCPYKIKLFLPILKIPLVSLVSHQISAFLILPFYFSSSTYILSYSFTSLQGWMLFNSPSFSSTLMVVFSYYMFSTFTLHIPFSLAFPSHQAVCELCCKHSCMKWFSVLPSSWESMALMILHVSQTKSLEHKWPVVQSKSVIILHTLVSPFHRAYMQEYRHYTKTKIFV